MKEQKIQVRKTFRPIEVQRFIEKLLIKKVERALKGFPDEEFKKVFASI